MKYTLYTVSAFLFMGNTFLSGAPRFTPPQIQTVAEHKMSLDDRYAVASVNDVMRDNILLTIAYMRGIVSNPARIDWETVRKPFTYSFELKPGETYAFQKDALDQFKGSITKTTNVHFGASDGFKSDGYLFGDGVCHLASLFYWSAQDAGLDAVAPTNHNFAVIPEIPAKYGVAIYSMPGETATNAHQNLYVKNNGSTTVRFDISYDGKELEVKVVKDEVTVTPASITQEVI